MSPTIPHPHFIGLLTEYSKVLDESNALDFDDLLVEFLLLLESPSAPLKESPPVEDFIDEDLFDIGSYISSTKPLLPETSSTLQTAYKFVMVDEFQDTNKAQYRIVRALAKNRNLMVVGDDDQAIYRWRGADIENIVGFEKDYPDCHKIVLNHNYRSSDAIIKSAQAVILAVKDRVPKEVIPHSNDETLVHVLSYSTDSREASHVAALISTFIGKGIPKSQIAVLFRLSALSKPIEKALVHARIPYELRIGTGILDREIVLDLIAYLTVLVNHKDSVSFARILNKPPRKIGATTQESLEASAGYLGMSLFEYLQGVVAGTLSTPRKVPTSLGPLIKWFESTMGQNLIPSVAIQKVLDHTSLLEYHQKDGDAVGNEETESYVRTLLEMALSFEEDMRSEGQPCTLSDFLQTCVLSSVTDDSKKENSDRVQLSTVHSAKGLEFQVVIVVGMDEGIFPSDRSPPDDERRLAYVAMTRAKKVLCCTTSSSRQIYGKLRPYLPSKFLRELPKGSYKLIRIN